MKSGIYKITNLVSSKVYIGQSRNLKTRIAKHKHHLKNNQHCNHHLQNSYNKYGSDSFTFEIIEYCNEDNLNERECYWILDFNANDRKYGYNAMLPKPDENTFYHSDESKQKMREANIIYSKEDLISYLQEYYYHFGKVPTSRDLDGNPNFPTYSVYSKVFGSYKEALIEAGLYKYITNKSSFNRKEYTKEEIIQMFRVFIDKHSRFPNPEELKFSRNYNLPSEWAITKHFKSRNGIKEALNYTDNIKNKEKEEALKGLRKLYEQDGTITSSTIDKSPLTRSAKYYQLNFKSLSNAYKLVGIPFIKHNKKTN